MGSPPRKRKAQPELVADTIRQLQETAWTTIVGFVAVSAKMPLREVHQIMSGQVDDIELKALVKLFDALGHTIDLRAEERDVR